MRNGASWMAEDKKDSRRAVSFRCGGEREKNEERGKSRRSEWEGPGRGKSPRTSGAREENKGKARKMCLTWQRQFFSRSCRLNARRREAIGSREEPAGKMAAISLQPPVEVFPLLPFILSLPPSCRDLRKEPCSRNKGRESGEETLILINCLIFSRDIWDALPSAGLVYISLDHCVDAASLLRWTREYSWYYLQWYSFVLSFGESIFSKKQHHIDPRIIIKR